jgi:hypothetical protein
VDVLLVVEKFGSGHASMSEQYLNHTFDHQITVESLKRRGTVIWLGSLSAFAYVEGRSVNLGHFLRCFASKRTPVTVTEVLHLAY